MGIEVRTLTVAGGERSMRRKYEVVSYSLYDYDGVIRHLEKRACQGWMIKQMGIFFWKYQKIDPQKLHFSVTYFSKSSVENAEQDAYWQTFLNHCNKTGWKRCTEWMQMQVFCNDQQSPPPLESDEAVKLNQIHTYMGRSFLKRMLLALALIVVYCFLVGKDLFDHPLYLLTSSVRMILTVLIFALLFSMTWSIFEYWRWYCRSKHAIAQGGSCASISRWDHRINLGWNLFLPVIAMLLLLGVSSRAIRVYLLLRTAAFCLIVVSLVWVRMWMLKNKFQQSTRNLVLAVGIVLCAILLTCGDNWWEQSALKSSLEPQPVGIYTDENGYEWEIYDDPILLTIEDLQAPEVAEETVFSRRWTVQEETFLASRSAAVERGYTEKGQVTALYYQIVDVKLPFLYDLCRKGLAQDDWWVKDEDFLPVEDDRWKAKEVYQKYEIGEQKKQPLTEYLICLEQRIVRLQLDWEPNDQQIAVICEKLQGKMEMS